MAKLFSSDPITKTRKFFHWNEADESFHIETRQDVAAIVERNKALRNMTDERARWGDIAQVGSIPMSVYFQLIRDGVIDAQGYSQNDPELLKWLSDSDNSAWRTRGGRLI